MNRELFPHQERALALLRQSLAGGSKRPLLQAPTLEGVDCPTGRHHLHQAPASRRAERLHAFVRKNVVILNSNCVKKVLRVSRYRAKGIAPVRYLLTQLRLAHVTSLRLVPVNGRA